MHIIHHISAAGRASEGNYIVYVCLYGMPAENISVSSPPPPPPTSPILTSAQRWTVTEGTVINGISDRLHVSTFQRVHQTEVRIHPKTHRLLGLVQVLPCKQAFQPFNCFWTLGAGNRIQVGANHHHWGA